MNQRLRKNKSVVPLVLVAIATAIPGRTITNATEPEGAAEAASKRAPRPRLTLSREVTYFTEPLAEDGLIDYPAALNQRSGKGVNAANNAVVSLLRELGPGDGEDAEAFYSDVCKRVGIARPAADAGFFVSLDQFTEKLSKKSDRDLAAVAQKVGVVPQQLRDQLRNRTDWSKHLLPCFHSPWTSKQEPVLAAWFEHNFNSLEGLARGSKLPFFHFPLDASKSWSGMAESSMISLAAVRVLMTSRARAMHFAGKGKHEAAWDEALALKRWAKLACSSPFYLDQCIGIVFVNEANATAAALMAACDLDEKRLREMHAEWQAVEVRPSLATGLGLGERCFGLEAMNSLHRSGYDSAWRESLESFEPLRNEARLTRLRRAVVGLLWDIDTAFAALNLHYDEMARIAAMSDRKARRAAMLEFESKLEKAGADRMNPFQWFSIAALDFAPRRIALTRYIVATRLVPDMAFMNVFSIDNETQCGVQRTMTDIAFAMEIYRAANGKYPERLADLVPALLVTPPEDEFGSGPLKYARQKDGGYVLYSVGRNGKDEAGKTSSPFVDLRRSIPPGATSSDDDEQSDADDLVIRVEGKR